MDIVVKLMDMEERQIWTQNDHYYLDAKDKFLKKIKRSLLTEPAMMEGLQHPDRVQEALAALQLVGINLTKEDLLGLKFDKGVTGVAEDPEAMDRIAATLAYFKIASKRVIDLVPMHIRYYLLDEFYGEKLLTQLLRLRQGHPVEDGRAAGEKALAEDGGLDGRDVSATAAVTSIEELMQEDWETAELRKTLTNRSKQLHEARRILSTAGCNSGGDAGFKPMG
jgi:hypothetical protein